MLCAVSMFRHGILAVSLVALGAAFVVACSDAGHDFGGYVPYSYGQDTNATEPLDASASAAHDASAPAKDAGARITGDASADGGDAGLDAAPPITAFTEAGAFTPDAGPLAEQPNHNFAGNNPVTSPAKQACLDCHKIGGAAMPFAFGGTVFADDAGTMPAAGVEIRVRDDKGAVSLVYTDKDGNFFARTSAAAFPAKTGARNATATALMVNDSNNGNCNSCHNNNAQAVIHVP